MRRIAVINQKGGVGKTTTAVNLGTAIAGKNLPVVLVDLDPQANMTTHLGIEMGSDSSTVYQLLLQNCTLDQALRPVGDNLRLAPSHIDLAAAEMELASVVGRETILRDAIEQYRQPYEFMLFDCPPSLGILTLNALCAADEVLITLQPHFLALQGLGKLLATVDLVVRRINSRLRVGGVVFCMYDSGTKLANEVVQDLYRFFEAARTQQVPWADVKVFETRIRRNIKLAEAPSFGMDIHRYGPNSHGAEDYQALCEEILEHYGYQTLAETDQSASQAPAPEGQTSSTETANESTEAQPSLATGEDHPGHIPGDPADGNTYT